MDFLTILRQLLAQQSPEPTNEGDDGEITEFASRLLSPIIGTANAQEPIPTLQGIGQGDDFMSSLLSSILLPGMSPGNISNTPQSNAYTQLFDTASATHGVSSKLLQAIAQAESSMNPKAKSPVGALGLMQLMPNTAKAMGVKDVFDPSQSIHGGARYLRQLLDMFNGNQDMAIAAYNAGPGSVKKYKGIPPFEETRDYVKKIKEILGEG